MATTTTRHRIDVAAAFLAGIVLTLVVASPANGGVHNCKPAWKCAPATPKATVRITPSPAPSRTTAPSVAATLVVTPPPSFAVTPAPTLAPTPAPTSTSTTGIPPMPSGMVLLNGTTGTLGKFVVNTYPDDHIGQPGQLWTVYTRYANGARQVTFHDGYADLRATRRSDGLYDGVLLVTGTPGSSSFLPTFDFQYGRIEFAFQTGGGSGAWGTFWEAISTSWSAPELDWVELIGGRWTANVHGSTSDGQKASVATDSAWHVGAIDKQPTGTSFYLDGRLVGTGPAMSSRMVLLADAKVGLAAPDATTGEPYLHLAWVVLR